MTTREIAAFRQPAITLNRIWQRCSNRSYVDYLKQNRLKVYYKIANRLAAFSLTLITTFLLVAMAAMVWQQVVSLQK